MKRLACPRYGQNFVYHRCEIGAVIVLSVPQGHLVPSAVGSVGYRPASPARAANPERQALPWDKAPDGANLKLFMWPLHSSFLLGVRACFLHVLLRSVGCACPTLSDTL